MPNTAQTFTGQPRTCPHCHIAVALAATTHCTNMGCGKPLNAAPVLKFRVRKTPKGGGYNRGQFEHGPDFIPAA